MNRSWIILLLVFGGCVTQHPVIPARYQLGTPVSAAFLPALGCDSGAVVLIGDSAREKMAEDGNTYTIEWAAATNCNSNIPNDPEVMAYNAYLITNVWPKFRMHMDLSLDGGQTWPHRIGYGLQTPKGGLGADLVWSPPWDMSLLTTNAMLRLVGLDGLPFRGVLTGAAFDVGTNGIRSGRFSIVGAFMTAPAAGATLYPDTPQMVTWTHISENTEFDLYWVTPTTNALMTTVSNCVVGVNTVTVNLPASLPVVPQMRLCVMGVQQPKIVGYSGIFEVQP